MIKTTNVALFFLAAGIFTSVTVLSAYQILFAIPLIYYTSLAIKNDQGKLPKSAYWLLGLVVIAVISLLINIDIIPRPTKNFGRIKYFLFAVGGIYVMRVWIKEVTDKIKKTLMSVFLLSIIAAGAFAIWKFLTIDPTKERVKSFTDTMRYGYGTGMILLPILSALLHKEKTQSWFDHRLGILAIIFGLIGMYLTHTRGALLGFLCAFPFVLYYYRPKLGIGIGIVSLLAIGTLGGFYLFGNVQQGEGPRFLMNRNNSGDIIRRSQWASAIIATQEKPIFGWGFSNFHTQVKRIKIEKNLDAKDYDDAHAHNLFLEIAAGTGIVGLLVFIGWILTWAWESMKADGPIRSLIVPFGVAFIISGQFEVTFDANNAVMIFFLYSISGAFTHVEQS